MNIALLLEMAAEAAPDRVGLVCEGKRWTYGDLLAAARGAFELIRQSEAEYVALLDESSEAAVIAVFGAALAGVPYCPSATACPTPTSPPCSAASPRARHRR